MQRTVAVTFVVLALSFAHQARAACLRGEANRIATVTITSCSATAEVARNRLGETALPWVVQHVDRILARRPGVVIAGRLSQKIYVEQYSNEEFRILDVVPSDGANEWFVAGENLSCEAFEPEAVVQIYATDKCCDVFPPMDVPCLLELGQASAISEPLGRFLESAGLR